MFEMFPVDLCYELYKKGFETEESSTEKVLEYV
jgi:hypothetical protein